MPSMPHGPYELTGAIPRLPSFILNADLDIAADTFGKICGPQIILPRQEAIQQLITYSGIMAPVYPRKSILLNTKRRLMLLPERILYFTSVVSALFTERSIESIRFGFFV